MVIQSEVQTAARAAYLDGLEQAALQALTAGATRDEVMTTLSAVIDDYQARQLPMLDMLPCDGETVFDELPEGMIDLPSAAIEFGISRYTLRGWVEGKHIPVRGRLRGSARGGGFLILSKDDILKLKDSPPKRGRPKIRKFAKLA